jgi:hypothetical protein
MRKLLGGDLGLDEASVHISECDWTLLRIPRPSPSLRLFRVDLVPRRSGQ